MSRFFRLVLAGLVAAFVLGAPAQAAPRSPDPELVQATAPSAAKALPSSVDSDVYAYAATPTFQPYFVFAGHLKLSLKSGSATKYSGSLVDYVGNKSYKASVDAKDATAPILKLDSRNGKFTFQLDPSFGSTSFSARALAKPSKLKVALSRIQFFAATHVVKSASYGVVLSERAGGINNPDEYAGTLTIAYDANGRISGGQITVTNSKGKNVTHALRNSGYYGTSYFYTVAQVDKKHFGLTATVSGTNFSGYGFAADGSKTTQWSIIGSA